MKNKQNLKDDLIFVLEALGYDVEVAKTTKQAIKMKQKAIDTGQEFDAFLSIVKIKKTKDK